MQSYSFSKKYTILTIEYFCCPCYSAMIFFKRANFNSNCFVPAFLNSTVAFALPPLPSNAVMTPNPKRSCDTLSPMEKSRFTAVAIGLCDAILDVGVNRGCGIGDAAGRGCGLCIGAALLYAGITLSPFMCIRCGSMSRRKRLGVSHSILPYL